MDWLEEYRKNSSLLTLKSIEKQNAETARAEAEFRKEELKRQDARDKRDEEDRKERKERERYERENRRSVEEDEEYESEDDEEETEEELNEKLKNDWDTSRYKLNDKIMGNKIKELENLLVEFAPEVYTKKKEADLENKKIVTIKLKKYLTRFELSRGDSLEFLYIERDVDGEITLNLMNEEHLTKEDIDPHWDFNNYYVITRTPGASVCFISLEELATYSKDDIDTLVPIQAELTKNRDKKKKK